MATTTASPTVSTDEALTNLINAKSTRDSVARTIAADVVAGNTVPLPVRAAYTMACVVVAAAEDMFLDAVDAMQAAS